MICRYRIVGPNEGRSTRVKDLDFVEGLSGWVDRPESDWEKLDRQMVRFYGCVREEQGNGGTNDAGQADVLSQGQRLASPDEIEVERDVASEEGRSRNQADEESGHERSEDPIDLIKAIDQLDPASDAHWTAAGKPSLTVLRQWTGQQIVRAEVDSVAGWMTRAYLSAHMAEHAQ